MLRQTYGREARSTCSSTPPSKEEKLQAKGAAAHAAAAAVKLLRDDGFIRERRADIRGSHWLLDL